MKSTRRFRFLYLPCLLALLAGACTSEGGPVGTGISGLTGNVFDVELNVEPSDASTNTETTSLPTIEVSIDEAGLGTETDAEGNFELRGGFSGPTIVRFSDPADGQDLGTVSVEVPAGATVFLRDIGIRLDLDEPIQLPQPPVVLNLFATVVQTSCAENSLTVDDEERTGKRFTVRLSNATEIVGGDGNEISCEDLAPGDRIGLEEGLIDLADLTIDAVKLVLDPRHGPQDSFRIRRRGLVLRVSCDNQLVSFEDATLRDVVRLRLTDETEILCRNGTIQPCDCSEIKVGNEIDVEGIRDPARSGPVEALRLTVGPRQSEERRKVVGDVASINCESGTMHVTDVRVGEGPRAAFDSGLPSVPLQLSDSTTFRCNNHEVATCRCEDVRRGDRVEVEALIPPGDEAPIRALSVTVTASPRTKILGDAVAIDCAGGVLTVETPRGDRVSVRIEASTVIEGPGHRKLRCDALATGDTLLIRARLRFVAGATDPILVATEVIVMRAHSILMDSGASGTTFRTESALFSGIVVGTDCAADATGHIRLIDDGGGERTVRLNADSAILRGENAVSCRDIGVGEEVEIDSNAEPNSEIEVAILRFPR